MELPPRWVEVLDAIAAGPLAWSRPAEIAHRMGLWPFKADDDLAELLADLVAADLLERWPLACGPAYTLTPLAAERLGLVIVEVGGAELPRWHDAAEPPLPVRQRRDGAPLGRPPARDLFDLTRIDAGEVRPATKREVREWCKHRPRAKETQRA